MSEKTATEWRHKDIWTMSGKDFIVQVSRHSESATDMGCYDSEGPHRWCVYAYVYPEHRHFSAFNGTEEMWQPAATVMPLHGGPSFCLKHIDKDGAVTSYQVGADYHHLHDWRYTQMATKDDARAVFNDAEELHQWLTEVGQ